LAYVCTLFYISWWNIIIGSLLINTHDVCNKQYLLKCLFQCLWYKQTACILSNGCWIKHVTCDWCWVALSNVGSNSRIIDQETRSFIAIVQQTALIPSVIRKRVTSSRVEASKEAFARCYSVYLICRLSSIYLSSDVFN